MRHERGCSEAVHARDLGGSCYRMTLRGERCRMSGSALQKLERHMSRAFRTRWRASQPPVQYRTGARAPTKDCREARASARRVARGGRGGRGGSPARGGGVRAVRLRAETYCFETKYAPPILKCIHVSYHYNGDVTARDAAAGGRRGNARSRDPQRVRAAPGNRGTRNSEEASRSSAALVYIGYCYA